MPSPDKHPVITEIEQSIEKHLRDAEKAEKDSFHSSAYRYREHAVGMEKALRIVKRHLEG